VSLNKGAFIKGVLRGLPLKGALFYLSAEGTLDRAGGVFALFISALLPLSTMRGSIQFVGKPDVSLSSAGRRGRGPRQWVEQQIGVLGDALGRQAMRLRGRPMLLGLVLSMLPCMIVL
jgi:hypothetical protein